MVIFTIVDYWNYKSSYLVRNTIKDTEGKYDSKGNVV